MYRLDKRPCAVTLSLLVGGLAFGGCTRDSGQPAKSAGSDELAMFVDDCADEYLTCRDDCLGEWTSVDVAIDQIRRPRVKGVQGAPGFPGAGGGAGGLEDGQMHCFYPIGKPLGTPAATIEYVLEVFTGAPTVHARVTFNPDFVDNTYGVNAIGWPDKGHKFKDLVGSDHAELVLYNKIGVEKVHFKLDYISVKESTPSGYGTLGVSDAEGEMILGNESAVVAASSSLDRNLNERGYGEYLVDSPSTNVQYAPNPAAPDWDFRVVYEVWVKKAAFGPAGFGSAKMTFVHASPSKASDNTLDIEEGECPSDWIEIEVDTGSEEDTDTGADSDSNTEPDTSSDQDTGTGSATGNDTGNDTDNDTDNDTHSDQTTTDQDIDTTEICLAECETVVTDCTEDAQCNETRADDGCVDQFRFCVGRCKHQFSQCAEHGDPVQCEPAFDDCVKVCVSDVDACAQSTPELPEGEDDVCDPGDDTGPGAY